MLDIEKVQDWSIIQKIEKRITCENFSRIVLKRKNYYSFLKIVVVVLNNNLKLQASLI